MAVIYNYVPQGVLEWPEVRFESLQKCTKVNKTVLGPSKKDIKFFGPSVTYLPTPISDYSHTKNYYSLAISDFRKPTHLPKNRISFMDAPLGKEL